MNINFRRKKSTIKLLYLVIESTINKKANKDQFIFLQFIVFWCCSQVNSFYNIRGKDGREESLLCLNFDIVWKVSSKNAKCSVCVNEEKINVIKKEKLHLGSAPGSSHKFMIAVDKYVWR